MAYGLKACSCHPLRLFYSNIRYALCYTPVYRNAISVVYLVLTILQINSSSSLSIIGYVTEVKSFWWVNEHWIVKSQTWSDLRVRAVFHKTVRVCHVYCIFKIGFTCRITVIFGTLKDGSLLINTLASNICFSYRNMFQNGVDALSKIVDAFLSKSSKFYLVRIIW